MAFEEQSSRVPTSIGPMKIKLFDLNGQPAGMSAAYTLEVLDQNGRELKVLSGDLVPHLTPAQINGLLQFMADLRAQAIAQVLP